MVFHFQLRKAAKIIAEYINGIAQLMTCQNILNQYINADEKDWLEIAEKSLAIKVIIFLVIKSIFYHTIKFIKFSSSLK